MQNKAKEFQSNYDKFSEQGRQLFLEYDQEDMIRKFALRSDHEKIYVPYLGRTLELLREDGRVMCEGERCPMDPSMLLYDMLTYSGENKPQLSGKWTSITGLGGIIGAGHDQSLNERRGSEAFEGKCEQLAKACESLGGVKQTVGDVSYIVPIYEFFPVWVQFWDGDEEFPANLKFLWDENTLQFIHYETVWYAMGDVKRRLEELIQNI